MRRKRVSPPAPAAAPEKATALEALLPRSFCLVRVLVCFPLSSPAQVHYVNRTVAHARAAALTDRGRLRSHNEDAFALDAERGIFVLCDGMGGAAAGEVASRTAADLVLASTAQRLPHGDEPRLILEQAIIAANAQLHDESLRTPAWNGMGTTVVAMLLQKDTAIIAHAGDSRAYRLRADTLEQITQDHSFVAEQVRRGLMTEREAAQSNMRNVITRAVGTQPTVEVDIAELPCAADDLYLLASDGLTRDVSDQEILNILRAEDDLEAACAALVAAANASGGKDNITCILVRPAAAHEA